MAARFDNPFLVIVAHAPGYSRRYGIFGLPRSSKIVGGTQHIRERRTCVSSNDVYWLAFGSLPAALLGAQAMLRFGHSAEMGLSFSRILGVVLIVVAAIFLARVFGIIAERGTEHVQLPTPFNLVAAGAVGGILVG